MAERLSSKGARGTLPASRRGSCQVALGKDKGGMIGRDGELGGGALSKGPRIQAAPTGGEKEEGPGFLGGGCREGPFGFIQKTGPGVDREVPRPGDNGSCNGCGLRDIPLPMGGGRRKRDSPMIDRG